MNQIDPDQMQTFLANPSESLGIELKQWIVPSTNEGKAKIVKACLALRNNNGGLLIIGFCDDGKPDTNHRPEDLRKKFHADVIQEIISKYASDAFEVTVRFEEYEGNEYPIIDVPSGVRTPVACKAGLPGDQKLLKTDAVYVRTLGASNTVSSSAAKWKDWERIIQYCFDNREADIGGFIRRHLSGLDLESFVTLLGDNSLGIKSRSSIDHAKQFLDESYDRFQELLEEKKVDPLGKLGTREVSVLIEGEFDTPELDKNLLWKLGSSAPRHTGWPPWVILSSGADQSMQSYVYNNGWEALLGWQPNNGGRLDFWRIEQEGRFYQIRSLEDDSEFDKRAPSPYTTLDFLLQISRTTEIISTAMSFARSLGADPESSSLIFALRWKNLNDRTLSSWMEPMRLFDSIEFSHQNKITTDATIPLDTPLTAITPYVEKIVKPLFALFGGTKIETSVIEGIVQQTVTRRM